MDKEQSRWLSVDVKSCSDGELGDLIEQLRGSDHLAVQLDIQKELIERTRNKGKTTQQIVDMLILGEPRNRRPEIAKEWAAALGITEKEFRRLISG